MHPRTILHRVKLRPGFSKLTASIPDGTVLPREYESQIDRRESQGRYTLKMKKLITILIGLAVLSFVAFAIYLAVTADSRGWAEVTVTSVSGNGNGGFDMALETKDANCGGTRGTDYINGKPAGRSEGRVSGWPLFIPSTGSRTFGFALFPDCRPGAVPFTNTPEFRALQALVGKTHRFYAGEDYPLYDFTYGTNHYQCIYSVIPKDEPIDYPMKNLRTNAPAH